MNISQSKESDLSSKEDFHVDVLECTKPDEYRVEEVVSDDAISSSSSFNDSTCAPDDSELGNDEAQSILCQGYPSHSLCDGTQLFRMRKKRLRDDWRGFIRHIMWRCRWLELKVKEFQCQARKYNHKIAKYYLMKQFELEKLKLEGSAAKSNPFPFHSQRVGVLKRRKRKRVEETTDVASYRSSHNLFSYAENRMPAMASPHYHDLDRKSTSKETEIEEGSLISEIKFSDDFVADALRKIDEAREKAQNLKRRADELMSESSIGIVNDTDPADAENDGCRQAQPVHVEDLSIPEIVAPIQTEMAVQNVEQLMIDISPSSFGDGRSIFPVLEDMEGEQGMNDDENAMEEELKYFRKVIDEITRVPRLSSEGQDPEGDPALTISTRKRKRPPTWMSRTRASRRKASI
ncbi:PREDICTED: uncharacterized protein LOC104827484 isoform X2 [Tarenaya hassleriana]|uniref:uncharacterized protein LOC104827484 isoform X2 n=1 Tax=Tarenaya hassleriana TaxID=28532 RepID=UPI00053C0D4F|nr:PREDICTED: uncharacterized protein LOC104827484 isoform X2 [Tarenaya hassleriana]